MRALGLVIIAVSLAACGPSASSLKSLQTEVRALDADARGAEAAAKGGESYQRTLKSGGQHRLVMGKAALAKVVKDFLPYKFKGKEISKSVSGNFTMTHRGGFKLLSRNQAELKLLIKGSKVGVKIKGYAKYKRHLREALGAGVEITVRVYAGPQHRHNAVDLKGVVTHVKLRKHNTGRYRNFVKDKLNKKMFKWAKRVPLPGMFKGKEPWMMTTANHWVIGLD